SMRSKLANLYMCWRPLWRAWTRDATQAIQSRLPGGWTFGLEHDHPERRDGDGHLVRSPVPAARSGRHAAEVPLPAAAVHAGVAIEHLGPAPSGRHPNLVAVPRDRGEVASDQECVARIMTLAEQTDDAVVGVVG